jgi:hypothetical protein
VTAVPSVKISFNIQCNSRINNVKMKVMHGVNTDKMCFSIETKYSLFVLLNIVGVLHSQVFKKACVLR